MRADVGGPAGMPALFDTAEAAFGPADILVNNAGMMRLSPLALQEAAFVETLAQPVDPAPAQCHFDCLFGRDRGQAGSELVNIDPYLVPAIVVQGEPVVKHFGRGKLYDLFQFHRKGDHRRHFRFMHRYGKTRASCF